jgi:hypothetical protein
LPFIIYDPQTKEETKYSDYDSIINYIYDNLELDLKGNDKLDAQKHLTEEILWGLGIGTDEEIGAISIIDERTYQLLQMYLYYEKAPHVAFNNSIWFETVLILRNIFKEAIL